MRKQDTRSTSDSWRKHRRSRSITALFAENPAAEKTEAFRRAIAAIPTGKVSTYGGVAAAAGFPRHHRSVARLLRQDQRGELPWHRVIGADGHLRTEGASAQEQRARLRLEGVIVQGGRVDIMHFMRSGKQIEVEHETE